MEHTDQNVNRNGARVFHGQYSMYKNGFEYAYDCGAICRICLEFPIGMPYGELQVHYANGDMHFWKSKWISSYNTQFGIAVSFDGRYVFAQSWNNGLHCLDARTGVEVWRTQSKCGVTSLFVNEKTLLCHQTGRAIQLLDIDTGEVLAEKRPAIAWGYTALDHRHVICQVTSRRWEIIDAQTIETKESFSHKVFTGGHENYCINKIERMPNGSIRVHGFTSVCDHSVKPSAMLPNLEFEHCVDSKYLNEQPMPV